LVGWSMCGGMIERSATAQAALNGAQSPEILPYAASSQIQKLNASEVVW
jgi:hypothetical protein